MTDLYDPRNPWASYLINAINAKEVQKKDVSYIVRGDQVGGPLHLLVQATQCSAHEHCQCRGLFGEGRRAGLGVVWMHGSAE